MQTKVVAVSSKRSRLSELRDALKSVSGRSLDVFVLANLSSVQALFSDLKKRRVHTDSELFDA